MTKEPKEPKKPKKPKEPKKPKKPKEPKKKRIPKEEENEINEQIAVFSPDEYYYLSFDIGEINMAYCMINNKSKIIRWGTFSISASTYEQKCLKLIKELDILQLEDTQNLPLIIIVEQQPKINAKMRVIEGSLIMYYTMKKMMAQSVNRLLNVVKIISYSPKYKLKCYTPLKEDAPIVLKCKEGYYKRKKLSVEHCRRLLPRNNQNWIEMFEKHKKKDDMSDTFLQALSYMMYDNK
jgi:hypothetical protein